MAEQSRQIALRPIATTPTRSVPSTPGLPNLVQGNSFFGQLHKKFERDTQAVQAHEQRVEGLAVWENPLIPLRFPKLFDIKADPFERAQTDAGEYARWRVEHAFALVPAQAYVAKHLQTYVEYPPRQRPGSFSLAQVLAKLQAGGARGN